jgi:AcrR family transcriptional regulator
MPTYEDHTYAEQHKELYNRVLDTAELEFQRLGIRAVRMDDIAHQLKISKRTLYQIFPDKETLLLATTKRTFEREQQRYEAYLNTEGDILKLLFVVLENHLKHLEKISPIFFAELSRYPSVYEYVEEDKKRRFENVASFLKKGVEQGCFRTDIDFNLVSQVVQLNSQKTLNPLLLKNYTLAEIFINFVITYFRGCCTEKGIVMIDKLLEKYRTNNMK